MKLSKSIILTLFFCVLLSTLYYLDIRFLKVDVVFYSALYVAAASTTIAGVILFNAEACSLFCRFEKLQLLTIWLLLGYILAISVPTVIDRSLSFYILEKLQQRGGGIQLSKFNYIFTNEYMREHRLIDVRLTEQQASGTIVIENGCVKLTDRGQKLVHFSQFFRKNLLPKMRLLNGEYTDQLTDPFQRSDAIPDYLCN